MNCKHCHKPFEDGSQTRKHTHYVFRVQTKTHRVSGAVCCLCITRLANQQVSSPGLIIQDQVSEPLVPVIPIPFGKEPGLVVL